MKNLLVIYPDYKGATYGTGILFKEGVADRNEANIVLSKEVLTATNHTGNFKEISGGVIQKGEGGSFPPVPPTKSEQLPWLDHFLADSSLFTTTDSGPVAIAGENIEEQVKYALAEGVNSLSEILTKTGLNAEDSKNCSQKIRSGGILLWIKIDDEFAEPAQNLSKKASADPIFIA
ncbi:hypothetical protein QA601_17470 [Chitinispirillales bacterium ANBcel5]|uniref:hypothetical protein n=1 Tax=Cellulosispirillum alkaliphilum TaxID=3039283 RepID=UPI002A577513|nr:hypothetical protein [Chitinispirillales bacterium ANBcel5]